MPRRKSILKPVDSAKVGSMMPEGLQKPTGFILEFLRQVLGDVPMPLAGFDVPRRIPEAIAQRMLPQAVERANEQGYTQPVYHATKANFSIFRNPISQGKADFGIHVTPEPETASRAVGIMPETYKPEHLAGEPIKPYEHPFWYKPEGREALDKGPKIMPLLARIKKLIELPDMGSWESPFGWNQSMTLPNSQAGVRIMDELAKNDPKLLTRIQDVIKQSLDTAGRMDPNQSKTLFQQNIKALLQGHGIDTVAYPNFAEGRGEHSLMLLDPRQLKSIWAKFDPAKFGKDPNILASAGGAAAIAGLQRRKPDGR